MLVERKACFHVAYCFFEWIGPYLAHIQPENLQNAQKCISYINSEENGIKHDVDVKKGMLSCCLNALSCIFYKKPWESIGQDKFFRKSSELMKQCCIVAKSLKFLLPVVINLC